MRIVDQWLPRPSANTANNDTRLFDMTMLKLRKRISCAHFMAPLVIECGSGQQPWKRVMFVGLIYLALGVISAMVSNPLQSGFIQAAIRVSIFLVGLAVYYCSLHLEIDRADGNIKKSALLTSGAVAVGAFLLAVYAIGMEWWETSGVRDFLLTALIIWPAATSIPAFLMALLLGYITVRIRKRPSRLN